ncbi:small GTP-binding protein [Tritrichomonas foetus]|uniref:Small GTP-binding protein n=1 Tax=Tritrichomonas foetus TaxID=1144522 RepID=A0A1J4KI40_9EUKA|nr:small GTP-binding protein [Tritrichomonas foetus]|eukprot:OHT09326.1 small GTP-binding protein [Tritrichomonas foetus]
MDLQNRDNLHRVVTIGETSVGKTSIITQLVKKTFNPNEKSTVGAMFVIYNQQVDNELVEMQIWDTAGQERFRSLGPIYYRGAEAAVVVFDYTSMTSFERLQSWVSAFQDVAGTETVIFVVGNKTDLKEEAQVSPEIAENWATERGFRLFSTSALTGEGVEQTFVELAQEIKKKSKKKMQEHSAEVDLQGGAVEKKSCC